MSARQSVRVSGVFLALCIIGSWALAYGFGWLLWYLLWYLSR